MAYSDLPLVTPGLRWCRSDMLLAALAAGALLLCGVLLQSAPDPLAQARAIADTNATDTAAPADEWQNLRVTTVQGAVERYSASLPGHVVVDERRAARVGSPLAGRVERVHVELGQRVARGAPLLTISSLELPALRSAHDRAQNELELARAQDARVQSMVNERLMPAKEALNSSTRLRQAELARDTAAARLRALRLQGGQSNSFVLRAEIAGTIVEKHVLSSQTVQPGETLLQIADLAQGVVVVADVFESDLGTIYAGAQARVLPLSAARDSIESQVISVSDVVDPRRHTVQVRMRVSGSALRVNERVQVQLMRPVPAGAVEIADTALLSDGEQQHVFLQTDDGRYQLRPVLPGWSEAGRVVVLSGLHAGERVVERGGNLLESQRWDRR